MHLRRQSSRRKLPRLSESWSEMGSNCEPRFRTSASRKLTNYFQNVDKDLYELEPEDAARVRSTPGSLGEVLDALESDHDWLLQGDVFTPDVIKRGSLTNESVSLRCELAPRTLRIFPVLRPCNSEAPRGSHFCAIMYLRVAGGR